eukprot:6205658-Pleurochrysis_carterae.AAC.1
MHEQGNETIYQCQSTGARLEARPLKGLQRQSSPIQLLQGKGNKRTGEPTRGRGADHAGGGLVRLDSLVRLGLALEDLARARVHEVSPLRARRQGVGGAQQVMWEVGEDAAAASSTDHAAQTSSKVLAVSERGI